MTIYSTERCNTSHVNEVSRITLRHYTHGMGTLGRGMVHVLGRTVQWHETSSQHSERLTV